MTSSTVINSFKSGLLLFAINLLLAVTKITPVLLLTSIILPGFLFGILLTSQTGETISNKNKGLFILLSGALYIFTSWIATGSRDNNPSYLILLATTVGALFLFVCYKLLLEKSLDLRRGTLFSIVIGLLSSVLPIVSIYFDAEIKNDWLRWALLFSVFLTWQPLFAWTLHKAKTTANSGFASADADMHTIS